MRPFCCGIDYPKQIANVSIRKAEGLGLHLQPSCFELPQNTAQEWTVSSSVILWHLAIGFMWYITLYDYVFFFSWSSSRARTVAYSSLCTWAFMQSKAQSWHSISICAISLMMLTVLESPTRNLKTVRVADSTLSFLWEEVIKTVSGSRVTHPWWLILNCSESCLKPENWTRFSLSH